jgi:hypothetical protein
MLGQPHPAITPISFLEKYLAAKVAWEREAISLTLTKYQTGGMHIRNNNHRKI